MVRQTSFRTIMSGTGLAAGGFYSDRGLRLDSHAAWASEGLEPRSRMGVSGGKTIRRKHQGEGGQFSLNGPNRILAEDTGSDQTSPWGFRGIRDSIHQIWRMNRYQGWRFWLNWLSGVSFKIQNSIMQGSAQRGLGHSPGAWPKFGQAKHFYQTLR